MDGHFENTDNYISSKKKMKNFSPEKWITQLTWTYELES